MKELLDRHPKYELLFFALGALLTALTLVFPQIGFLEWVSMIPMLAAAFHLCSDPSVSLKKCYRDSFFTVYLFYWVLYHWFMYLHPLDFAGLSNGASLAVTLAGWWGLPLLQAISGGLVFVLFALLHRTGFFRRYPILQVFAFSAIWTVFEWSTTLAFIWFPWGRLGLGQIKTLPMLQISSWFGPYFVSFLIVTVNGLLAYQLLYRQKESLCFSLAVGIVVGNLCFGAIAMNVKHEASGKVTVAVIQGNINSHDKWDSDSMSKTQQIYADMTKKAAEEGAELVVWPETALPYSFNNDPYLQDYASELAVENQVTLIVGALYEDAEEERNSLYLVTPDGKISEERYDKRHLVPFGEYVPLRKFVTFLFPPLADLPVLDVDLSVGEDSNLFTTQWGKIGSMICFDSIYSVLGVDSVRDGAGLMLISSNDSWFFDSAAVYQHEAQAQMRAIETGRYFVRSANTGISAVIAPNGEILRWIDPLTDGFAVCEVEILNHRTLYSVIGNLFVVLCGAFCLAIPLAESIIKKKSNKKL